MFKLFKRSLTTAAKLPFAVAWDCVSLGNMGEGSSTSAALQEHKAQKSLDNMGEIAKQLSIIAKIINKN